MKKMTTLAAVIGDPINHSLSPILHNHWLKKLNINGQYQAINIKNENLNSIITDIRNKKYAGINVTLPHKQNIMQYCDILTPTAQIIKAVNTIWLNNAEQICGGNSDAYGFSQHLPHNQNNKTKIATIIGTGGAARAITLALIRSGIKEIRLTNRTLANAQQLAQDFKPYSNTTSITTTPIENINQTLSNCDLLINCSSAHIKGEGNLNLDFSHLPKHALVNDISYKPLISDFLQQAQNANLNIHNGLTMLIHQALFGFLLWFKPTTPPNPYDNEIYQKLKKYL